jgi:hypothetical protein
MFMTVPARIKIESTQDMGIWETAVDWQDAPVFYFLLRIKIGKSGGLSINNGILRTRLPKPLKSLFQE